MTSPTRESEITWLLHRAAQRMHVMTGEQAGKYGLQVREYIILSAMQKSPGLTQAELAKTVGLDKTTLMSQLDRLEQRSLVFRRPDVSDRRVRIPEITAAGNDLRAQVAEASATAEAQALAGYAADDVALLRRMLFEIIGDSADPGSCL